MQFFLMRHQVLCVSQIALLKKNKPIAIVILVALNFQNEFQAPSD